MAESTTTSEKKKTYVMKEKKRLFFQSRNYKPGGKIELTDKEAKRYVHFIESPKTVLQRAKKKIINSVNTTKERINAKRDARAQRAAASVEAEKRREKQKKDKKKSTTKKQSTGSRNKQIGGDGPNQLNRGQAS
jgi:hypothetical protein